MTEATFAPPKTVSHVLGEIVWLFGESPLHQNLAIKDLKWLVMPPVLLEQFRIYPGPGGKWSTCPCAA